MNQGRFGLAAHVQLEFTACSISQDALYIDFNSAPRSFKPILHLPSCNHWPPLWCDTSGGGYHTPLQNPLCCQIKVWNKPQKWSFI